MPEPRGEVRTPLPGEVIAGVEEAVAQVVGFVCEDLAGLLVDVHTGGGLTLLDA